MTIDPSSARAIIAAQALSWLGTPYHHHARIKGVGVDCAQILAAVFEAAGVVQHQELGNYAPQWHLHHSAELYVEHLQRCGAHALPTGTAPQAGDVGVWRFGRTYSHGGVVVEGGIDPLVVHAYVDKGVIVNRASEAPLNGRHHLWFSLFGARA